jgi:hypothetical protein
MSHDNCIVCGKTSEQSTDGALHSAGFSTDIKGMHCWDCWHKSAIQYGAVAFRNGVVGENSGWTYEYTLTRAIEEAVTEIDDTDNADMGITVDAPIGGSYCATAIVRAHQLYIRVANMADIPDDFDARIAYIDNIVKQLTFELLQQPKAANP